MKKGTVTEGYVEEVAFPNKGLVRTEEGIVQVKNVLVGQKVEVMVQKARAQKAEGRLLQVLDPSPQEIPSACPHFTECGGCTYQNLPYKEQKALKQSQVRKLLKEYVSEDRWDTIKASPQVEGYRNKMEFSFGDAYFGGPLSLGMHKRGSFYDIVTVDQCRIVDSDYRQILSCVLKYCTEQGMSHYHRIRHTGYLRHLLVRKAIKTGEILIALVTTSQEDHDLTALKDRLLELGEDLNGRICGILHTVNDSVADIIQSDKTTLLYGKDYFYEELLGLIFRVSQFSFFQTNSLGAEVLYKVVRDWMKDSMQEDGGIVYDLYSGTGTIAQLVAPVAKSVIGVEIVEEAVKAARVNAASNGLTNCRFIAGDVLKVLDEIKECPDIIILDPPRDGIHPKALPKILAYGVDKIIYISCKPTSLARDLETFIEAGYVVDRAVCVDMFPGTVHVETVVLLSQLRQRPDDYIEVDVDVAELEGTSAETKATYEKIKKYVAEHNDGMKVSSLYIAQVKRKCGIELAENFNLPKSADARQPQCPKDKEEAITEAFKAFQMI